MLCALASAKPIVFPSYWRQYELMSKGQAEQVPNPENFIPTMSDKRLLSEKTNLCLPNVTRKTLFKDKIFVFPSTSSYEALKIVVEMAGECHHFNPFNCFSFSELCYDGYDCTGKMGTNPESALKSKWCFSGGQTILLSESSWTLDDYCQPHVVVLSCEENKQTSLYKKIISKCLLYSGLPM